MENSDIEKCSIESPKSAAKGLGLARMKTEERYTIGSLTGFVRVCGIESFQKPKSTK